VADLAVYYGLNSLYIILYDQLLYYHKETEYCFSVFLHYQISGTWSSVDSEIMRGAAW
jgi:hypothetical protein